VRPAVPEGSPNTTERLRADIDHGRTGDKVDFPDPAAAPLGTDDEAAGTPASRRRVAQARAAETKRAPGPEQRRHGLSFAWGLIALLAALTLGCALWMFVR
jgi:hypothetical protein